jgi:hypothetical protein
MKAAFVVRDLNGRLAERAQTSTALTLFLGTGFGDRFGSSEGCSGSLKERIEKEPGPA